MNLRRFTAFLIEPRRDYRPEKVKWCRRIDHVAWLDQFGPVVPNVPHVVAHSPCFHFFRRTMGRPVKNFAGAWRNLCTSVGVGRWECDRKCGAVFESGGRVKCACGDARRYVGLIVHDVRRSAARALRTAGVPESVIMAIGGWKTPSMLRRYAIVSSADQRAAMESQDPGPSADKPPSLAPGNQSPNKLSPNRKRRYTVNHMKLNSLGWCPEGDLNPHDR